MFLYRTIIKFNRIIIILILVIATILASYIRNLTTEYDISSYFPKDDHTLKDYEYFTQLFGFDDDKILISVTNDQSVFSREFLTETLKFESQLKDIPNVEKVYSLHSIYDKIRTPLGFVSIPFLHNTNESLKTDSMRIMSDSRLKGLFISMNAKSFAFYLDINRNASAQGIDDIIERLISLSHGSDFSLAYLAGDRYTRYVYKNKIRDELKRNMIICIVIVTLFLFISLRSFWGVIVLLLPIILSILIFLGLLSYFKISLGIMSNYYPIILLIMGLTTGIHIINRYEYENRSVTNRRRALLYALRRVGYTTFLSSFTTSVGFLTLNLSPVSPIRQFGNEAAFGVMISYVISILLIPSLIELCKLSGSKLMVYKFEYWNNFSKNLIKQIWTRYKIILIISIIILLGSLIGLNKIEKDNYLINSKPGDILTKSRTHFETNYGGLRNLEILIKVDSPGVTIDMNFIRFIDQFEQYVLELNPVKTTISSATIYKSINKAYNGGISNEYKLPEDSEELNNYSKLLPHSIPYLGNFISNDFQVGRISARVKDIGRLASYKLHDKIYQWFKENTSDKNISLILTGMPILIDRTNEIMVNDLYKSLLLAFSIVSILLGSIFINFRYVVISWIVNIYPLIIASGSMGILNIPLMASTSIIFTIGFVIAVDDTIHFISNFRLNEIKRKSKYSSLILTFRDTVKAMFLTSILLISGFSVLILSDFEVLYYNGFLICIIVIFAFLTDVFLIPVLIRYFKR